MSSSVDWSVAERIAVRTSRSEPFARSYHYDSLEPDFTRLTALAESLVEQETGLRSLAGPARARVTDRAGWIHANISAFRRLLDPLIEKFDTRSGSGLAAPVMAKIAGAELGMVLGWMSGRVLGQYDLLVVEEEDPLDQDIVYYVGPNVLAIEKKFAFPPEQFRLWLALHEVTHRAQFTGVPWLREHFISLVHETVGAVDPDPGRLFESFSKAAIAWRSGTNPLADGGIAALVAGPEQRVIIDQVTGMMSLLEGHGDVTMDRAGQGLVPSAARFGEVLRERRESASGIAKLIQQLIGLEAKLNQYAQGEAFIAAVERAGGPGLLSRAWESAINLPSLLEIREPYRWIERMQTPVAVA
jgi:coenzyme F420 biosynthesis associated uncharacterized protein